MSKTADALLLTALPIASLHALIPSHWLPFAMVGRAQRWSTKRTLRTTALAGAGHVLMTTVLGLALSAAGKATLQALPPALEHTGMAVLLIAFGLYFLLPSLLQKSKGHSHEHGTGHKLRSNLNVIGALALGLTLSPCLDILPLYIAASRLPWSFILLLSGVMAIITLAIMVGLVWLTLLGLERLNLHWLEHNEGPVVGSILIVLGALLFLIKT